MSMLAVLSNYLLRLILRVPLYMEQRFGMVSGFRKRRGYNIAYLGEGIPVVLGDTVCAFVWDTKFPIAISFEFTNKNGDYSFNFEMRDIGNGIRTCVLPVKNRAELVLMRMLFDVVSEFDDNEWSAYKLYIRCAGAYARVGE